MSIIQILNFLNRFAISLISMGTIVGTILTLYRQIEYKQIKLKEHEGYSSIEKKQLSRVYPSARRKG